MPGMYDWDVGEPDFNMFEALNTHAPNTPSFDFLNSVWGPTASMQRAPPPANATTSLEQEVGRRLAADEGTVSSDIPSQGQPQEIPDGQPYDSPWVSLKTWTCFLIIDACRYLVATYLQASNA